MGPQSLLQYMVHSKFTGVWMNQWVGVRGWKRFLVFIVYLLELLEFFLFFLCIYNSFCNKIKTHKNVLFTFGNLSICFFSFLHFRSLSFLFCIYRFPSKGSDQRSPLRSHLFLSLLNSRFPYFVCTAMSAYPIVFCWAILPCLVGESTVARESLIHPAFSKDFQSLAIL